ncbi:MAG: glycosyltransferase [Nocardioidaceae bacterium]|nr:glycosyltransferase [Nocardioidaceae bacterium]
MRVLHVSEVSWGGVVSVLSHLTSEQVRRGYVVTMLVPPAFPDMALCGTARYDWAVDRRRPVTFPRAVAQLRSAVGRHRPDVVHLHSAFAGFFGRLPLLSGMGAVPVVYQPHAWSFDMFDQGRMRTAAEAWERLASRRTDMLVANCTDEIVQGERVGVRGPARPLGVPLDVDHFHEVDHDERARQRAETGVTRPRSVLCVGRLARQKGQDLLVAAWEADPVPDTELVLVGPGDPEPLRRLAPREWGTTIRWEGEQADVRPYLWASDLLVLPSRYETVAVVVAEAMACGLPVVACAVNGVQMAVTDGPYPAGGRVVGREDAQALLEQSRLLLADAEQRAVLSRAGRQRVTAMFTPALVTDLLDSAYDRARTEKQ